jgi:hypothetical protein
MSGSKGRDLLMANRVADMNEELIDTQSFDDLTEKSAGHESVEELNCGFFDLSDHYLNGYSGNGDLFGSSIRRREQQVQAGTNYWFCARNPLQFNFRQQEVNQRDIPNEGMLTDASTRGD